MSTVVDRDPVVMELEVLGQHVDALVAAVDRDLDELRVRAAYRPSQRDAE